MGTGKTSVGERLAQRARRDRSSTPTRWSSGREGRSVAAIFASHGEAAFRAAERRAIGEAWRWPHAVVATGGGAIVDADNRAALRAAAPIVCLTARPDVILARATAAGADPAVAAGRRSRRAHRRAARRAGAPAYAQADLTIDTSTRASRRLVAEVARLPAHAAERSDVVT